MFYVYSYNKMLIAIQYNKCSIKYSGLRLQSSSLSQNNLGLCHLANPYTYQTTIVKASDSWKRPKMILKQDELCFDLTVYLPGHLPGHTGRRHMTLFCATGDWIISVRPVNATIYIRVISLTRLILFNIKCKTWYKCT